MHAQACVCWSKYTTHDIIQVEQKYAACVKNKAHVCHHPANSLKFLSYLSFGNLNRTQK